MHLRRLVISGFKSFGSKTTLEFAPGITAVVGPNGSGKSNVADAIRWVFGEQSMKLLRAKRSEDLVFAGTKSRKSGSMAEVSLEFDNSDGGLDIPHSEIVLARRLYRSGENEYLINRKKVRLVDIIELLARSQVSQSNYTVIGQGMVDQFITLSPKERKELLDEAVGVKQYYLRRDQAQRKLISTKTNLEQASAIVRELEPHLTHLRRIAKRAEEREAIAQKLDALQQAYYAAILKELRSDHTARQQDESTVSAELREVSDRLSKLEGEAASLSSGSAEAEVSGHRNLLDTLQKEREDLRYRLAGAEARRESAAERVDTSGQQYALKAQLRELESEADAVTREIEQHRHNAERYSEQLAGLSQSAAKAQTAIAALEHDLEEKASQPHDLRGVLSKAVSTQGNLLQKMKVAKDGQELESLLDQLERSIELLAAALHDEHPIDQDHLKRLTRLRSEAGELAQSLAEARAEALSSEELHRQSEQRLAKLRRSKDEASAQLSGLQTPPSAPDGAIGQLDAELKQLQNELASKLRESTKVQEQLARAEHQLKLQAQQSIGVREEAARLSAKREALQQQLTEAQIQLARIATRLDDISNEAEREIGGESLRKLDEVHALGEKEREAAPSEIDRLKQRLSSIGDVDAETLQDLTESEERHAFLTGQITDLEKAGADLDDVVAKLDVMIKKDFHEGFEKIASQFAKYFELLFDGGKAKIELSSGDDGELGIEVSATPPGKRLSSIATLSGGEKSLTSVALLCAFLRINPSPFIVLDEVDAALDEANTRRFASIIRDLGKKTQFILITHNRRTMELADVLYGVTMGDDHASAVVSVRLDEVLPSKKVKK